MPRFITASLVSLGAGLAALAWLINQTSPGPVLTNLAFTALVTINLTVAMALFLYFFRVKASSWFKTKIRLAPLTLSEHRTIYRQSLKLAAFPAVFISTSLFLKISDLLSLTNLILLTAIMLIAAIYLYLQTRN